LDTEYFILSAERDCEASRMCPSTFIDLFKCILFMNKVYSSVTPGLKFIIELLNWIQPWKPTISNVLWSPSGLFTSVWGGLTLKMYSQEEVWLKLQ